MSKIVWNVGNKAFPTKKMESVGKRRKIVHYPGKHLPMSIRLSVLRTDLRIIAI